MDANELRQKLTDRLEDVCQYLLPGGRKVGNYWHAGDVSGKAGDSLRVSLSGPKRGVWLDGSSSDKGGIIDLWIAHYNLDSIGAALPGIREWLGVKETPRVSRFKKKYTKPDPDEIVKFKIASVVKRYLSVDRQIPFHLLTQESVCPARNDSAMSFLYYDDKDELTFTKTILLDRPGGKKKVFTSGGARPILYGMNSKSLKKSARLVVTEGEIDRLSYEAQDIGAVSVPFGAKGEDEHGHSPNDEWIDNCWTWLEQFEEIILSFDGDDEGQKAAKAIAKRLGEYRCKNLVFPQYKDANEAHCAGSQLTEWIAVAKPFAPDGVVVASEMDDKVWEVLHRGPREMQGHLLFDWEFKSGLQFRLRPREGTIVTGYAGMGKSNFLYMLASWLAVVKGERVFVGSYEEPAEAILAIMATQVLGRRFKESERKLFDKIKDVLLSNIVIHDWEGTVGCKEHFKMARYAVKRHGCRYAIMDSLSCTELNLDENNDVKLFAQQWQSFWQQTGAHHITVAHPRKDRDEKGCPGKQDIKGSGVLGDLTFNVLAIHRYDNEDDDKADRPPPNTGFFKCDKQKVGGQKPKQKMFYDPQSYRYSLRRGDDIEPWIEGLTSKGIPV